MIKHVMGYEKNNPAKILMRFHQIFLTYSLEYKYSDPNIFVLTTLLTCKIDTELHSVVLADHVLTCCAECQVLKSKFPASSHRHTSKDTPVV